MARLRHGPGADGSVRTGAKRVRLVSLALRFGLVREEHLALLPSHGLDRDRDAVNATLTLPYSNGPTEGVSAKIKRIARQMHGRAGFTLLRHRILLG